jgi:hypothetical protein
MVRSSAARKAAQAQLYDLMPPSVASPQDRNRMFGLAPRAKEVTVTSVQDDSAQKSRQWRHDFRDALGGAMLAASAARLALQSGRTALSLDALTRLDASCARCVKLLDELPLDPDL